MSTRIYLADSSSHFDMVPQNQSDIEGNLVRQFDANSILQS